eukprot:GGOE01024656.1.p2 GENE.GGOE01024656.1~~GGOE01024656.1.p2  ORF type:complete len:142 (-),score=1.90 GGOE01024656.1:716-1141(-)
MANKLNRERRTRTKRTQGLEWPCCTRGRWLGNATHKADKLGEGDGKDRVICVPGVHLDSDQAPSPTSKRWRCFENSRRHCGDVPQLDGSDALVLKQGWLFPLEGTDAPREIATRHSSHVLGSSGRRQCAHNVSLLFSEALA